MTEPDYGSLLDLPMTDTERLAIKALVEHGSQNKAAEALGWKRTRLQSRLRSVQRRAAAAAAVRPEEPERHGRVEVLPNNVASDPDVGTAIFVLTAAQNNTPVHGAFLDNLEAYAECRGARLMISRFTYNKAAYGSGKPGTIKASDTEGLWYDPRIEPYVCDDPERHGSCRWQLAPDLVWCAELNILPTAVRPLSGLDTYAGGSSAIVPHAKLALESLPVMPSDPPRFLYTTGAVTQRNYLARKAGQKGEFHHAYAALVVEVDLRTGDWWVRQLNANDAGDFDDLFWSVRDGSVADAEPQILAVNWGDVHASEVDHNVAVTNWGRDGVLACLDPIYQIWHDTLSFRNRSHHETKSFASRYSKWAEGEDADSVEREIEITARLMRQGMCTGAQMVVVSSNHDRHGERWLDETDFKQDLPNAAFYLEAQLARVKALQVGGGWRFFEWAVQRTGLLAEGEVIFLGSDESFLIGPPGHEVECGSHGDLGPNGSRGSTANLGRVGRRINKGHDHTATIRDGVYSAGVCNRRLPYTHGPTSWSVSHIVTYTTGKRCIITMRGAKHKFWL